MVFFKPLGLFGMMLCSLVATVALVAQQPQQPPQNQQNPFETVPQTPPSATPPSANPFETPKEQTPEQAEEKPVDHNRIEAIDFRGARRIPQATLRALIYSKKDDVYDEQALRRDFMLLWNTGRFDDIRLEVEDGRYGKIVRFVVTERRIVRSIKYEGLKSITMSEVLERFKDRRVGLSTEANYDPNKVQRAVVVLMEYLAERGRQYARIQPEVFQIPPASVVITFIVDEGPKVKVGEITFDGVKSFSPRVVRRSMANSKPIGIPYSIFLENMFSRAFDSVKLEEDKQRLANFYQERGYFRARVVDTDITMRDVGGGKFRIPLFYPNKPGKRADLHLTVEEGPQYKLNEIKFEGVKLFRTPEALMRPLFQMDKGDIFSTKKLREGLDNLRKLYGGYGYIDFVPEPSFDPVPDSDQMNLTLSVDEGKQFFVRRIEFSGNTTTRDKVIRRELLVDEGDMFNTRLWEVSILRLNQLGYFDQLKKDEATDIKRDNRTNTVDLTLSVKERGRNTVGLTGGVSGIAGSFVGMNYSTNNFLGLGETLSLSSQLGDRIQDVVFGFTEPYFLDKPIQAGFSVYTRRFNFDQGREVSLFSGRNYTDLYNSLGSANRLNYSQNGYGFSFFASTQLKRSFARVGLSYGYDNSNIKPQSDGARIQFETINFLSFAGQANQLEGIVTSRIVPSYSYNTVNHPITPTAGRSLFISTTFAGGPLGGSVKMFLPTVEAKYFRKGFREGHVIGMRGLGSWITGFGGQAAPPFNRFYMGGENDVRGFNIWEVSPVAFIPSETSIAVLNADGSQRLQRIVYSDGTIGFTPVRQTIPIYQISFPGGDTMGVANFEYRIPIFGPVTLAAFFDAGINRVSRTSQLRLNPDRVAYLNAAHPSAAFENEAFVYADSQKIRTSTGLELQVMMPVVNAPFRLYWAYNPTLVQGVAQAPIVFDRSQFANDATFSEAIRTLTNVTGYGGGASRIPFFERRSQFRFTVSRTF
ncbi:MAG: outer membrane protein assembly factor BamA [Bryobacterales bacterium]|nr:outer membrane protein assembly factor BamA [Bryobacterales bacterium]